MSDIELVIKLSEEEYKYIMGMQFCILGIRGGKGLLNRILNAIRTGIPIPKGHGGLIGVQDAVDNLMEYKEIGIFGNYDKLTILGCIDRIKNHVEPIIEEDKE